MTKTDELMELAFAMVETPCAESAKDLRAAIEAALAEAQDTYKADLDAELAGNALLRKRLGARENETMFQFVDRLAAEQTQPVARLLHWIGPKPVPHGGIAARTYAEFAVDTPVTDRYWAEGEPLYTHPPKEPT